MAGVRGIGSAIVLVLGIAVAALPARAEMTVQRFQELVERGQAAETLVGLYLHSFLQAAYWMHADFTEDSPYRQKPLTCMPIDRQIVPGDLRDELIREFETRPELYKPQTRVGPVLFELLQRRYPCP